MNDHSSQKSIPRKNNFDLIRILAALQVVYSHGLIDLKIDNSIVNNLYLYFIRYFQGVPIFFFVSGFLIYWSFSRNSDKIKQFYWNRFLRLFPPLWLCLLVTIAMLAVEANGATLIWENIKGFMIWIFAQVSFFQFYTPEFLRFWGTGTPNGALWTIVVELQFYFLVPLLFYLFKGSKKYGAVYFVLLCFASCFLNFYVNTALDHDSMLSKLMAVFIGPYLYYFCIGVAAFKMWDKIHRFFVDKFLVWFAVYITFSTIVGSFLGFEISSYWIFSPFNIISDILVAGLTLSFAFSYRSLSDKILKGNDISYGVYIYHMLVVNFFIQHGFVGSILSLIVLILTTLLLGLASWHIIEKRSLKLKKWSFWDKKNQL